jgi:thioredoxin reductase
MARRPPSAGWRSITASGPASATARGPPPLRAATAPGAAPCSSPGRPPASDLARKLGCRFEDNGGVEVDRRCHTCIPACTSPATPPDVLQAIVAAGEGAAAAAAMNAELTDL